MTAPESKIDFVKNRINMFGKESTLQLADFTLFHLMKSI